MRAERRRKLQLRKELEEAGEGAGTGGGGGGGSGGDTRAVGGALGNGGVNNTEKTADDRMGAEEADGTSGTSISAPKLAEKSSNANSVDADKGKRGDAGCGGGDENTEPEAKKKKVVQEEDDDEEEEEEEKEEENPVTPYDVSIVVQCKEAKSRQTLTLPSDSTIGFVKRDYIKARGHALSLELFDSLVFFYNGYPVTDGLVIGVISTPGVNLELHVRF